MKRMNDNINRNGEGVAYGAKTLYMVIMHVTNLIIHLEHIVNLNIKIANMFSI